MIYRRIDEIFQIFSLKRNLPKTIWQQILISHVHFIA